MAFLNLRWMLMEQIRRMILMILFVMMMTIGHLNAEDSACEAQRQEKEIKAGLLIKFANFIEWPHTSSVPFGMNTFVLGILGEDPFGPMINPLEGKIVKGRRLEIKRAKELSQIGMCHVLFIGPSESSQISSILNTVKRMPTLTVGDMPGFAEQGGIINFYMEKCYVRFEINIHSADRAGLKISSRLLRLAKIVSANP